MLPNLNQHAGASPYKAASFGIDSSLMFNIDKSAAVDGAQVDFENLDLNTFITKNMREFEMFKKFMESQGSLTDLLCWMDIEAYIRIDANDKAKIEEHACMLKKRYFNKKYFFARDGPIDPEAQNLVYYSSFYFLTESVQVGQLQLLI